ncbi:probable 3',5'-cyclic phosphodiesterase pde-5 isoform X1 [Acanthaster planci]|uniref:Phosphodiesterase n=1 Tax=Acanthaster planci TaxID=133434 RepID=A0A8B7YUQ0_ACAPL|nr:probable 3',5'-cyclic phosphodiesterase pde-5 isoform X1 [Acanthaster planci]XP_022097025.1 probable 3',5'-cyclic phosphodiesterase pde-5 isoform X1 [Acanthaster planci]
MYQQSAPMNRQRMSGPSKQTASRRLPPLPAHKRSPAPTSPHAPSKGHSVYLGPSPPSHRMEGKYAHIQGHYGYGIARSNHDRMIVTGQSSTLSNGIGRHRGILSHPSFSESVDIMPDHILQEQVRSYLNENPAFLEDYVLSHVDYDILERWTGQVRAQKHKVTYSRSRSMSRENSGKSGSSQGTGPPSPKPQHWKKGVTLHDRKKLVHELTQDLQHYASRVRILQEMAKCVASQIQADGFTLYLVTERGTELYEYNADHKGEEPGITWPIGKGKSLAGYVAHTLHTVNTTEIHTADYPEGVVADGVTASTVLALPVLQANEDLVGVLEFYRDTDQGHASFTDEAQETASAFLVWGSIAVHYAQMCVSMSKQRKLNDFLLTVTKSIFQDIISMDTVIMKIMNFAQKLVSADRASLFLVDNKTRELYARIFDVGNGVGMQVVENEQKEIRFSMDKGVAGYVASTGQVLNIPDAYLDERFNRDVDQQTGYVTKTILCMPIYNRGNVIGVVQMVNKKQGYFTKVDEQAFETFAVFCGLALHHAKLYDKIHRSEQKHKVALEVLSYHSQCYEEDLENLKKVALPDPMPQLARYDFSPWGLDEEAKPLYVLCMFQDMFTLNGNDDDNSQSFDYEDLCRFILTVRKNYRKVPYHNWTHAFSVAHSVYTIIKTCQEEVFTPVECLALFVACLCHDLDHRGKNNSFMVNNATPLAAVYSTSTMEHHHFNMTITILQNDGHNIFKHLTSDEYKQVLSDIRHAILATDLALFFGNKAKLKAIVEAGQFSWENQEHRKLLKAIAMTACDLCAVCKPFDIQRQVASECFEEFYTQGDEEKAQGRNPIPMMDRSKSHELPTNQVSFIVGICLPCYDLLSQLVPNAKPMYDGAARNLQNWSAIVAKQKAEEEEKLKQEENAKHEDKRQDGDQREPDTPASTTENKDTTKTATTAKNHTASTEQPKQPDPSKDNQGRRRTANDTKQRLTGNDGKEAVIKATNKDGEKLEQTQVQNQDAKGTSSRSSIKAKKSVDPDHQAEQ